MNKKQLKIVQSAMLANKITLQKVSDSEKHEKNGKGCSWEYMRIQEGIHRWEASNTMWVL